MQSKNAEFECQWKFKIKVNSSFLKSKYLDIWLLIFIKYMKFKATYLGSNGWIIEFNKTIVEFIKL